VTPFDAATGPLLFRASPLADVPSTLNRGGASHHGALGGSGLEVGLRLLHELVPIALGIGGDQNLIQPDPHLQRPAPLRA
jgi:hypothetical protein